MARTANIFTKPLNTKLVSFSDVSKPKIIRDCNGCVIGLLESDSRLLKKKRRNKKRRGAFVYVREKR
jgi:hypothetical protein